MSRFSYTRIAKGGRLIADEGIYNEEIKKWKIDKGVEITSNILFHLGDECDLEEDVTFKDILLLLKEVDLFPILSPMFTKGPWLDEIVKEGLSNLGPDKDLNAVVLNWKETICDDFYTDGKSIIDSYIEVVGRSDNQENYALDFTPIYNLINCKIILDKKFIIYDGRTEQLKEHRRRREDMTEEDKEKESFEPILLESNKNFTLFDILCGIFYELSFHGSPEDRNKRKNSIMETIKKIESGEEKTIPWEEMKDKIISKNKL